MLRRLKEGRRHVENGGAMLPARWAATKTMRVSRTETLQETPPLLPAVFMMPQGTAAAPRTSQSGRTDWRATRRRTTPTNCCALMQTYMSDPTACTAPRVTGQGQKRRPQRAGAIIVQCEIITLCAGTFKNASAADWVSDVTQSMPSDDAFRSTASWNASATREASCNWTSCASCVKCSGCCGILPATFHVKHMMFKSNRSAHFDRRRCSAPSTHDLARAPPLIVRLGGRGAGGGAVGAALLASEHAPLQS
jgi:hypothetical protein